MRPKPSPRRRRSSPNRCAASARRGTAARAACRCRAAEPGFEERFGTRWVVWIGGLALALGGFFLVRYSIEQGLIGPGVRVFLGALLALALIAAGEWARRKESISDHRRAAERAYPRILTAAGTTVAYATVYAAYALYGFLVPAFAFVLLGVVALATLAAALLHGPALAGLGLVGAYVTPLLVSTDKPNYWALYIYLAVVTAAAFGLARMRLWRWLAVTAIAFARALDVPGPRYRRLRSRRTPSMSSPASCSPRCSSSPACCTARPSRTGEIDRSRRARSRPICSARCCVLASAHADSR